MKRSIFIACFFTTMMATNLCAWRWQDLLCGCCKPQVQPTCNIQSLLRGLPFTEENILEFEQEVRFLIRKCTELVDFEIDNAWQRFVQIAIKFLLQLDEENQVNFYRRIKHFLFWCEDSLPPVQRFNPRGIADCFCRFLWIPASGILAVYKYLISSGIPYPDLPEITIPLLLFSISIFYAAKPLCCPTKAGPSMRDRRNACIYAIQVAQQDWIEMGKRLRSIQAMSTDENGDAVIDMDLLEDGNHEMQDDMMDIDSPAEHTTTHLSDTEMVVENLEDDDDDAMDVDND